MPPFRNKVSDGTCLGVGFSVTSAVENDTLVVEEDTLGMVVIDRVVGIGGGVAVDGCGVGNTELGGGGGDGGGGGGVIGRVVGVAAVEGISM